MPKLAKAGPRSQQEGNVYRTLGVLVLASTMGGLTTGPAQAAQETPQSMLAAQIRMQGFACDKPLGAVRDRQRSKPDHAVWVLKCGNATYRVNRAPDMAAKVEPLR
ncbi:MULTISPECIES: hypothetical protein [unclassified Bradyrhizobium]|uniref:hypothetical protein n=1 Tax=unclassified Bradyrhizobium TaxID=2631580 RepID=UPI00230381D2|nr:MULTISPECIES: hypothetical protein [unclassified Bradyrhizobium]